jgi:DNA polymerase-1
MTQMCYGGVKLLGDGPDLDNVERLDMGALPMINRMAATGLQVDLSHFAKMDKIIADDMEAITEKVHDITGHYINLDSGAQISDLLFKKLGLKQARPKLTKSGDRESVDDEVLTAIQHEHEVVPTILEFKEYSKLLGTYVRPMPKLARKTGFGVWRMYPNFGCTRVPSGRLNCKEPNLLAMPNRTDRGREVCEGFITRPGWVYLSVDESQIEPRVVAHRSGDVNLKNIYFNEEDIYSDFAISAFKLPDIRYKCNGYGQTCSHDGQQILCDNEDHRTGGSWHYPSVHKKKQRFPAKTCILASIYDVSGKGLAEQMPVVCGNCGLEAVKHTCGKNYRPLWNENNCQDLINAFYIRYPGIMKMRMMDHARARKHGYVWDEFGRLLHVTGVRSVLPWVVSSVLREAANFPIQSTAQGTVKITMHQVDDEFLDMEVYGDIANPLLQIHDELLFEVREDLAEEIGSHVADRFENCIRLEVPIKASTAKAPNWGTLPK